MSTYNMYNSMLHQCVVRCREAVGGKPRANTVPNLCVQHAADDRIKGACFYHICSFLTNEGK